MVKRPTEQDRELRALHLVEILLDAPEEQTAALLDEHCGDDAPLRDRVERLLAAEREHGAMPVPVGLPDVASLQGSFSAPEVEEGMRIGSFELLRPIGSGGMGRVWEALQSEPRRRVALKMLRFGLESSSARRRFQYESEVLGHLRHPGIAQVYEAGVHLEDTSLGLREVPYFALEFVEEARSLAEWADEEEPTLVELLEVFRRVCDAVHHGHQKGVVHRDLKPANILVDRSDEPKIIDFGVARVRDAGLERAAIQTLDGELVGTPPYMSPEQLGGDLAEVDVRSDVYSLGVVLYELVCGRLPIDVEGLPIQAAAQRVAEGAIEWPRRVAPTTPRDVEAILLRALATDPARRYPSVLALSEDLGRFLAHEPVGARAPSPGYRARLFLRRHRVAVASASLVLLSLLVSVAVSTRAAIRAREAETESSVALESARSAEQKEREQRLRAEEVSSRLREIGISFTSSLSGRVASLEGSTEAVREMLGETVDHLEALAHSDPEDAETRLALVEGFLRLGDVLGGPRSFNVGDDEGAERCYLRAEETLEECRLSWPDRAELGELELDLVERRADLLRFRGEYQLASELYEELADAQRAAIAEDPADADSRVELAEALGTLGGCYGVLGGPEEALLSFTEALAILEEVIAEEPDHEYARFELGKMCSKAGAALMNLRRYEEALGHFDRAIAMDEALSLEQPENVVFRLSVANGNQLRSMVLRGLDRIDEARESSSRTIEVVEALVESDPSNVLFRRDLGAGYLELGRVEIAYAHRNGRQVPPEREDVERALEAFQRSAEVLEGLDAEGKLDDAFRRCLEDATTRVRVLDAILAPADS